jgi:hypothetical protein
MAAPRPEELQLRPLSYAKEDEASATLFPNMPISRMQFSVTSLGATATYSSRPPVVFRGEVTEESGVPVVLTVQQPEVQEYHFSYLSSVLVSLIMHR